ncbi:MAG: pilus assembly protein HicB [Bacteroidaceae bacterium]|nr:pilus assembly protein HicB [Bacteroidaceae bacterium]
MKATIQVEKGGDKNFSTYMIESIPKFGIHGYGSSAREAIADTYVSIEEYKQQAAAESLDFPELELTFRFDIGSFFNYYSFLNISEVAKRIGINASLMRQYVNGTKTASDKRIKQINDCVHTLATDMASVVLHGVSLKEINTGVPE